MEHFSNFEMLKIRQRGQREEVLSRNVKINKYYYWKNKLDKGSVIQKDFLKENIQHFDRAMGEYLTRFDKPTVIMRQITPTVWRYATFFTPHFFRPLCPTPSVPLQ